MPARPGRVLTWDAAGPSDPNVLGGADYAIRSTFVRRDLGAVFDPRGTTSQELLE